MQLHLPKRYLSWSAYNLWHKDREQFRKKYYEGIEPPVNKEALYGKDIAKMMEDPEEIAKHEILSQLPAFERREQKITTTVNGVPILAFLDSFDPISLSFRDLKTGHRKPDGTPPWDAVKVRKHGQLPFYSLAIQSKFGNVSNRCYLDWVETRFKIETMEFDGHTLEGQTNELELTGHWQTFERDIEQWERDRMAELIKETALAISEDYYLWQRNHN